MSVLRVHACLDPVVAMAQAWASALTLRNITAAFKSQTLGQAEMSALSAEATLSTTCLSEGEAIRGWIPPVSSQARGMLPEGGDDKGGGEGDWSSYVAVIVVTGSVRATSNGDSATGAPGQALWPTAANMILGAEPGGGLENASNVTATSTPTLLLIPSLFALSAGAQEAQAELAAKIEVWGETCKDQIQARVLNGCPILRPILMPPDRRYSKAEMECSALKLLLSVSNFFLSLSN